MIAEGSSKLASMPSGKCFDNYLFFYCFLLSCFSVGGAAVAASSGGGGDATDGAPAKEEEKKEESEEESDDDMGFGLFD